MPNKLFLKKVSTPVLIKIYSKNIIEKNPRVKMSISFRSFLNEKRAMIIAI